MGICVTISFISIFSVHFCFSITILSCTLILLVSQLQTVQQVMMSQIRSHIEYLMQTYNILMLILYSKFMKDLTSLTVLIRFNDVLHQMFNVSALLMDDELLKCVVTEVVLFSSVAFKTLRSHKVM